MTHFISDSPAYIYCLLIAAIIFAIYKITNRLKGYKIPMLEFVLDIEKYIIKDIVILCRGDPGMLDLIL